MNKLPWMAASRPDDHGLFHSPASGRRAGQNPVDDPLNLE